MKTKYIDRKSFKKFILKKLDKIVYMIGEIQERNEIMSQELDTLTVEVQETRTVVESAIVFIQGLSAQLQALANDPAAILALAAELDAQQALLANAIATPPVTPP